MTGAQRQPLLNLIRRYAEVAKIGKQINQEISTVEELFQKLCELTGQILDTSHLLMLAVHQYEQDTLDLHLVEDGVALYLPNAPLGGFCAAVLREPRTLLVRHLSAERTALGVELVVVPGTSPVEESLIFVPLMVRDRPLGVLSIQSRSPNTFDEEDAQVLELLGNHVALALGNIRLFNRLTQVNTIGRLLTDRFDDDQVLQHLTDRIREALLVDLVLLYRFDGSEFVPPVRSGELRVPDHPPDVVNRADHVAYLALRRTEPLFARDSTTVYAQLGGDPTARGGSFERREEIRSTAILPLLYGDQPLGVLFVNYRQPQRFDALQRQVIESMASYAAVALRSSQRFADQASRQLRELEILREIDQALGATLDLQKTLQVILEQTLDHINAFTGSIYLYDSARNLLETSAFFCPSNPDYQQSLQIKVDPPEGLVGTTFQRRRPLRVADVKHDPQWSGHYISVSPEVQSELDVPMIDGDEVVGVINVEGTLVDAFSRRDEEFLVTLAGQAVLAIKKAQAYEREKRSAEESSALSEIGREIISRIDPKTVFNNILDLALKITSAQAGTLMLYDSQRDYVQMAAGRGVLVEHQGKGHPVAKGVVGRVVRERRLINVPDVMVPPWSAIHLAFIPGVRSELAVPLLEGERLHGVLNVESVYPNHFTERDERLLTAFADQALIVLQHGQRFQILDKTGEQLAELADPDQEQSAYQYVIDGIVRAQPDCQVAIRRINAAGDELYMVISRPDHPITPPERLRLDAGGLNAYVAETKKTFVVRDTQNRPPELAVIHPPPLVRSMICTPLLLGTPESGRYYGNLTVLMEAPNQVLEVDQQLMEGLARLLAMTLSRLEITRERLEAEQAAAENDKLAMIGQLVGELLHKLVNEVGPGGLSIARIERELKEQGIENPLIERELKGLRADHARANQILRMLREDQREARALLEKSQTPRKIRVAALLEDIGKSYPYDPAKVSVIVEAPPDSLLIYANHQQVHDLLRNLFTNAVQALPSGGRIRLRAYAEATLAVIEVEDTGPGIPEADLKRIFEPNFTTKPDGNGFGLFSARRYARINRWQLTVRSRVGVGSTFVLSFPLAAS